MACSLSPVTNPTTRDVNNASQRLRRSFSSKELLLGKSGLRRSYSENHLCCSISRVRASAMEPKLKNSRSGFFNIQLSSAMIPDSLRSFLFYLDANKDIDVNGDNDPQGEIEVDGGKKRANWMERLMELRNKWKETQEKDEEYVGEDNDGCDEEGGCEVEYEDDAEGEAITIDRDVFSSLLRDISRSDTKLYAQLSFLCNMAYVIEDIKTEDLKRCYGLDFVTSSLEKKAEAAALKDKIDQDSTRLLVTDLPGSESAENSTQKPRPRSPAAYHDIAASAACYVQSRTKDSTNILNESELTKEISFSPHEDECKIEEDVISSTRIYKSEIAACVAASTMTSVVAAGEKQKEKAAKDLQSLHSSPCEWFICDDSSIYTRSFVIQGSDSLASWQANLFFEPTIFEGMDALVHRGIYEAAKGIYDQFLPEIKQHLNRFGDRAKFQFTGHSLGGSLALLVNLMLLRRKAVKPSSLLPVVTFGSPFIFCGGQKILEELNIDENHVRFVMMHRDIVPRAFSCNYPNYVAQVLKRLNSTFRFHPCLNKNKLLYSPMGKIFILQPDEKSSPPHPLLPQGSALYALDSTNNSLSKNAFRAFLNAPHPLETLSDPSAYGSEGTIIWDHDSSNYLKAMNEVIRQHTRLIVRKATRQRNQLWPLLTSRSPHAWSHTCDTWDRPEMTKKILTRVAVSE
ncbi:LOW QUALITY PROTEIN: phospholipase A1 PLIP1, chloroplastic-like [Primulina eburnea]|uniref:LOW QUALITY PROTEIN: phospholipase A1 PLIP1, chloroplastic-like n=1 Tax=Primulina eburnea TaxID=1245227 RepID=UPI003C6C50BC